MELLNKLTQVKFVLYRPKNYIFIKQVIQVNMNWIQS